MNLRVSNYPTACSYSDLEVQYFYLTANYLSDNLCLNILMSPNLESKVWPMYSY